MNRDPDPKEFEQLYAGFVAAGGLEQTSCLSEDYERLRGVKPVCLHGLTRLTCPHCRRQAWSSSGSSTP